MPKGYLLSQQPPKGILSRKIEIHYYHLKNFLPKRDVFQALQRTWENF